MGLKIINGPCENYWRRLSSLPTTNHRPPFHSVEVFGTPLAIFRGKLKFKISTSGPGAGTKKRLFDLYRGRQAER
jgi:hypothetical protein